eukprot:gene4776-15080_t
MAAAQTRKRARAEKMVRIQQSDELHIPAGDTKTETQLAEEEVEDLDYFLTTAQVQ